MAEKGLLDLIDYLTNSKKSIESLLISHGTHLYERNLWEKKKGRHEKLRKKECTNKPLELYILVRSRSGLSVMWGINTDHKFQKENMYVCFRTNENMHYGTYDVYYIGRNELENKIEELGLGDKFKKQYESIPLV